MSEPRQNNGWFSVSRAVGILRCPNCGGDFSLEPSADHHPRTCPNCAVETAFLNWKDRLVMIVPHNAPAPVREVLRWMQQNLDELEYVQLVCALEEISDVLCCKENEAKPQRT
jgi:hypothetical protein